MSEELVSQFDVRIGKIVKIQHHENADTLFFEEVDIGEGSPRKIVTGVRKYYTLEQMQDRLVLVFANIKPSKIRGLPSEGMLFAASNEDHSIVELLEPPPNSVIGERVKIGDYQLNEKPPVDNKTRIWKAVSPHLKINSDGTAMYKEAELFVSEGKITVPTLRNCQFH